MAKTKTFGVRLAPELIAEMERLKDAFAFSSYGEMMEGVVRLLKDVDEGVSNIDKHPRNWTPVDLGKYLFKNSGPAIPSGELSAFTWRRLRNRFGEDGVDFLIDLTKQAQPQKTEPERKDAE